MAGSTGDSSERYQAYPTNRLLALLDSPQAAEGARADLIAAGVAEDTVEFLCGKEGLREIKRREKGFGLIRRTMRAIMRIGELAEYWNRYEDGLREGKCLLAVDSVEDSVRRLALEKIKARGGHFINFVSSVGMERLAP